MAAIEIKDVTKIYPGGVTAIKGLDLSINDGELVVLVGPSGCGKSTLLRMIAGLETITEGEISIGEKVVNKLEPAERDIAMVFQNYALYPHMSVRGNLEYGLKNRGTPKAEINERVDEAARILEIGPFLDRKPRQLSGGQRQRVAMGRAIVRKPKAFLFDEPLSNLDAKLRGHMRVEIRRLQRTLGTTSVYVTHDQLEAMTLADKLVVMNGGVIEQVGKPLEIYSNPASVFVAAFMGSPGMNLFPVGKLTALGEMPTDLPQKTGTIGIRPEDFLLQAPQGAHFKVDGTLDAVELVGSESLIYVSVETLEQEIIVRTPGVITTEPGTEIALFIPHTEFHCFDGDTGRKLERHGRAAA